MGFNRARIFKFAKGFRGRSKNVISIARLRVYKALQHATRNRHQKKRDMSALWITRINAGSREHGVSYSALMHGLKLSNIRLNNKTLSNLALNEPFSFKALVDQVKFMKGMLPGQKAAQQAL